MHCTYHSMQAWHTTAAGALGVGGLSLGAGQFVPADVAAAGMMACFLGRGAGGAGSVGGAGGAATVADLVAAEAAAAAVRGGDADSCLDIGAGTVAGVATSDTDSCGGGGVEGHRGPAAEGLQWACAACTFLNSALLPCCELCDATRTTDPPPSPQAGAVALGTRRGGATGSPRKRAGASVGKETKQAKPPQRQADRTNPSIRTFFSRCSDGAV